MKFVNESLDDIFKSKKTEDYIDELYLDPEVKEFLINNNFIYITHEYANVYSYSMDDPPFTAYLFKAPNGKEFWIDYATSIEELKENFNY